MTPPLSRTTRPIIHEGMGDDTYDAIVLGVGGMGSAAAFELARRGRRVLALEQFALGHDRGSSHGHTRIIRKAYYEHPDYVPLVLRAWDRWRDLERRCGRTLLTEQPCLTIGRPDGELIAGVRQSAARHGLPVEALDADDLRRRFPAFCFSDEYVGLLEHSAGFLYVDDCVRAYADEARKLGAVVRDNETGDFLEGGGRRRRGGNDGRAIRRGPAGRHGGAVGRPDARRNRGRSHGHASGGVLDGRRRIPSKEMSFPFLSPTRRTGRFTACRR